MTTSTPIDIQEQSQVAEARRVAAVIAGVAELSVDRSSDLAIIITELATNLLKHAGGGTILVGLGDRGGINVISLDHGPGIANLDRCMRDGYSTTSTPGSGLGAISRLSRDIEIYTQVGKGTAIFVHLDNTPRSVARVIPPACAAEKVFQVGGWSTPMRGESVCGDCFAVFQNERHVSVLVADGLGHGPFAADASAAALALFEKHCFEPVTDTVGAIHNGLRSTRGAAVAIAQIDVRASLVHYCGIGNIAGAVVHGNGIRRMVSHNGTAGLHQPRISLFTYPWEPGAVLLMHSDGLTARWNLEQFPGLASKHPALLSGVLYRDFSRERDDTTVVSVRGTPS